MPPKTSAANGALSSGCPFMPNTPVIAALFTLTAVALLSACNTVQGAGRDVSSAGQAVSNAAKPAH
jgi:predicted small secreted protein